MPTYRYRCGCCGDFTVTQSMADTSTDALCLCGQLAPKVFSMPAIASAALPNKGARVREIDQREKRWDRDMPAYKRLRREGLQPRTIDDAHELETCARTKTEIESGRLFESVAAISEGQDRSSEMFGREFTV